MNASFFIPAKTGFRDCDVKNDWVNCFLQDSFPNSNNFYLLLALWKPVPDVDAVPVGLATAQQGGPKLQLGGGGICSLSGAAGAVTSSRKAS